MAKYVYQGNVDPSHGNQFIVGDDGVSAGIGEEVELSAERHAALTGAFYLPTIKTAEKEGIEHKKPEPVVEV